MPRCYFDVKNGHRLVDPAGIDCAGDGEAKQQARIIASQIAQDDCTGRAGVNDKAQGLGNPPGRQRSYSNKSW
jgi:hypothetical protein